MRRIVRLAGALATIALAAGMTLAGTGTARADVIPPASGFSEIFSPYLNAHGFSLCFDDPNGSTSRGNAVQLYHCHGYASNGAPQRWVFIQPEDNNGNLIYDSNGSPVYEIYNIAAGLCLTAPNLAAGPQLTMDTCNRTRPVPAETVVNRPNEAAVTSIPPSTGMRGPVFRAAGRTGRPGPAPA